MCGRRRTRGRAHVTNFRKANLTRVWEAKDNNKCVTNLWKANLTRA
jgi:hypothetical protein